MPIDTETITNTAYFLSSGSVSAVVALLITIIGGLLWERMRLLKKLETLTNDFMDAQKLYAEKITELHNHSTERFLNAQTAFSDKSTRINQEHTNSIKELINAYHDGNLKLVQSMNDLTHMIEVVRR